METSVLELKRNVQILLKFLEEKKAKPVTIQPHPYTHRVDRPKGQLDQYYETTTPRYQLGDFVYDCTGRLKFYGDKMLYLYLEVEEMPLDDNIQLSTAMLWPVKCTWKVEIIDENDTRKKPKALLLGEASCVFNKPRQGRKSHPNDWISFDLGKISLPCSITVRWTVTIEPLLNGVCVEEFQILLEKLVKDCDSYDGSETLLSDLKQNVDEILKKENENGERISRLKSDISQSNEGLNIIEAKQGESKELFKTFSKQVLTLLKKK